MDKANKPPPDFSSGWILKDRRSLFFDFETKLSKLRIIQNSHKDEINWLGYMTEYEHETGLAGGREFDIFGKGVVVKFWGLQEERFNFFSVFVDGQWHVFPNKDYVQIFRPHGEDDNVKVISRMLVLVYRSSDGRNEQEFILSLDIPKF